MASNIDPSSEISTKFAIQTDKRDIKDLWNDALKDYEKVSGISLKKGDFKSADEMLQYGLGQKDTFSKWRHDGKQLDKIRRLFMQNIDYIEKGTQKLLAAAVPAFPPAAAISTAMTFVLNACKGQSTDYNTVTAFFEDMNSFLQRVTILEGRLPEYRPYQACLMDVFTSFLAMCAVATKFISKGRLKTWIINSVKGQDADLSSSRARMDKNMKALESTTNMAILANTEGLQLMQEELIENQQMQEKLAREQTQLLESITQSQAVTIERVDTVGTDVKAILALMEQSQTSSAAPPIQQSMNHLNSVATKIQANIENDARMRKISATRVKGTGEWLFQTQIWKSWLKSPDANFLLVQGAPGIGKTCLAAAAYNHLRQAAETDPERLSVVTYFFCDDETDNLQTFVSFISSVVLQISDQNPDLRDRLSQLLAYVKGPDAYWKQLVMCSFGEGSKYRLHVIIDNVNEFEAYATDNQLIAMLKDINEFALNVKVLATVRSASLEALESPLQSNFRELPNLSVLTVSKDDVFSDIELLVANEFQVKDDAQGSLAHLRTKTQRKITDHVQERADTLLYVDFALKYLSGIGREGAIIREIETGLADNTAALFEGIIRRCKRYLPHDLEAPVQTLLIWLTYSFDLLDFDQANQLARISSQGEFITVEEEIEHAFGRILQIGPTTKTSEGSRYFSLEKRSKDPTLVEDAHDDGNLLVSLRDRSMKKLLRNINIASWGRESVHGLVNTASANHRTMFLLCCDILGRRQNEKAGTNMSNGDQKLREYAANYCLRHWQNIDCDRHNLSENREVCDAFYNFLSNPHGFAAVCKRESVPELRLLVKRDSTMPDEAGFETFYQTWQRWARLVREVDTIPDSVGHESTRPKHIETASYWKDSHDQAFVPLFEAHMQNWLNSSTDYDDISDSYRNVLQVSKYIPNRHYTVALAAEEYWTTWNFTDELRAWGKRMDEAKQVYVLRRSWRHPLTSTVHLVTALALFSCDAFEVSHREMQLAAEKCSDASEKAQIYMELGELCRWLTTPDEVEASGSDTEEKRASRRKYREEALSHLDMALGLISDKRSPMRLTALVQRIYILEEYKEFFPDDAIDDEIANIFTELKVDPPVWHVDGINLLSREIEFLSQKHDQLIDFFTGLTPIQRLSAVLEHDYATTNLIFLPAAVSTKRTAELQKSYIEILDSLKLGGRGIIWYATLAHYLYRVTADLQMASDILEQASDHTFTESSFLVKRRYYASATLSEEWLNLASDVIFQQSRSCNTPDAKLRYLQEAKELPLKPIVRSVQMSTTSMLPHLIVLARMQKRVGSFQEYQKVLQQAFDICWDNLHDCLVENDFKTLQSFSKILAIGPGHFREAEIIGSAQLYQLGNINSVAPDESEDLEGEESEEFEGPHGMEHGTEDITYDYARYDDYKLPAPARCSDDRIGHICPNSTRWTTWKEPMYMCLCCTDSFLCQDCYNERIKRNISGTAEGKIDFCCNGSEYLKVPIAGWKGIRSGVIYIENEEPIEVNVFLDELRKKWKKSWEEFWKG